MASGNNFEWTAFQGSDIAWTTTLSASGFDGSESLTTLVYTGDNQAAVAALTTTWNASSEQTSPPTLIDTTLPGSTSLTIPPGGYRVLVKVTSTGAALAAGQLDILAAPGGVAGSFLRSLATQAQAQVYLSNLSSDQLDALPSALGAATVACENWLQRKLLLTDFDHFVRLSNTNRVTLRTKPVQTLTRLKAGLVDAIKVQFGNTASQATVRWVMSSSSSLQPTAMVLESVTNGITTSTTLTLSSYATVTALASAIAAVSGWAVWVDTTASTEPPAEIIAFPGSIGALASLGQGAYVQTQRTLSRYSLDATNAILEVNESLTGGTGIIQNPRLDVSRNSRVYLVRATYRAGYAYLPADIALGYDAVPDDLVAACIYTAQNLMEGMPASGPVKSQTVKDRSYVFRDDRDAVPPQAERILAAYVGGVGFVI